MTDRSGPPTGVSFLQSWSLITVLVVAIPLTVLAVVFWPGGAPLGPDGPDSQRGREVSLLNLQYFGEEVIVPSGALPLSFQAVCGGMVL